MPWFKRPGAAWAQAAWVLCALLLAVPTWGQTIEFSASEYTVTEGDVHRFYRANRSQTVVPDLETVVLPVQVTGTVSSPVTVRYETSNVTAVFHPGSGQAQDYVSKSGTLTFTSSPSTQTITIQLSGDDSDEPDERFRVTLSNPSGAELGTTSVATVVIEDDDEAPIVAILGDDSRTVFEGETITFTVVAATTSSREVTVGYGVTSGSAVAGDDVPEVGGILTIAAHGTDLVSGTTSVHRGSSAYESTPKFPIAIAIPVDDVADAGETFTFSLTAMPDTVDGLNNARVENIASIHGTGGSHRHVSIDDLPPNDRARDRYGPAVTSVTVTIRETVIVEFTRGGYAAGEGHHDAGESGEIVFTVEATGIIAAPLEVAYATAPGTALDAPKTAAGEGIDFYANSGTITFMPDEVVAREIEITVALRGDDSYESNENFTMTISDPDSAGTAGLQIGSRPTATGTVRNDDPVPTLAILGPSEQRVREGHSIVFTVVSSATSSRTTDFSYRTGNTLPISAAPNVDYQLLHANDNRFYMNGPGGVLSTNRSLSGSARLLTSYGDTATLEITVNTIADQVNDDGEQFIFAIETRSVGADPTHGLAPAKVGSVAAGETLGRIVGPANDEVTVTIIAADVVSTLSIEDAGSVREGDALIFNMRLTDPMASGEVITAPAGGITGTYSISRVNPPTDPYHAAAISDYAAPDDGTATNDGGYTGVTFTIPEGHTMYPIVIETNDLEAGDGTNKDTGHESNETIRVTLTTVTVPTTGVTIDTNNNAATGTILDNDEPPVVSIGLVGDATRAEDAGNVLFTVSVATTSSNPLVISYAPASGSTAGAADTTGATGSLTIPAFPYLDAVPTARLADDAPNYPSVADLRWTITVAITDDEASERPETLTLQLTSPDPSIATISETAGSADLTINDNDPGLLLLGENDEVLSSTRVDEGDTSTYQVVLVAPPDADVTVNITEQGGQQALTLSAASLVFDNTNWNTARTVTITGTRDADADDGMANLVHSVASTATGYANLSDYNLSVTIVDNDEVADLAFTDADGEALGDPPVLAVTEGDTTEYAVALFSQPTAPVTLTISSSDSAKATIAPATLTFTADNWDTAQPLTVSGLDDPDGAAESLTLTHDVASTGDIRYDALSDILVRVTVIDNDEPGLRFTPAALSAGEGDTATYAMRLSTLPSAAVTVDIDITPNADAVTGATPQSLIFTTDNWDMDRQVTVTAASDDDALDETATLTHAVSSTDTGYDALADQEVEAVVVDDERSGLHLTPSAISVDEEDTATYAARLSAQPSAPVTVDIDVAPQGGAVTGVTPQSLVFTADNWDTDRQVTVTGGADDDARDDMATLTHAVSSTDADYNALEDVTAVVTVTDNDTEGVRFTPEEVSVNENDTATYAVRLTARPGAPVTIDIDVTPQGGAVAGIAPQSLVFTADNWSMNRQVTVTAGSDNDDRDDTATITHDVSSADIFYDALPDERVEVVVVDDERYGLHLAPSPVSVDEDDTATYAVRLTAQPSAPVTVDIGVTPQGGAVTGVTPQSLVFTADDWDTDRQVTVTAAADNDTRNDRATLTHALSSTDANYNALADVTAVVVVIDDDVAGVRLTPDEVSVNEGDTATYAVRLNVRPSAPVTVAINVTPQGGAVTGINPQSLVFTTDNWNADRQVTVTAGSDDDADDETAMLTHAVSSTDTDYDALADKPVEVTVVDDDERGITIAPSPVAMGEEESTTYTVVLDTIPTGDGALSPQRTVEVALAFTGASQQKTTVSPQTLTFTASDWNAAQTVTLSALADEDGANEVLTITHTPSGSDYAGVDAATLVITIADDDAAQLIVVRLATDSNPAGEDGDTYGVGERIELEVEFSRPVVVRGTPQLKIQVGENERLADYAPPDEGTGQTPAAHAPGGTGTGRREPIAQEDGVGSTVLHFAYTVQPDDEAPGGITIPDNPITLDGTDAIVDAEDETQAATIDLDEDAFEVNIPAETAKVDGGKDFMLSASAGDDQGEIDEDTTVTLDGSGSKHGEPDVANITYAWKQKEGAAGGPVRVSLVDADKPKAIFNAPNLKDDADFAFVLTVSNTRTDQEATDEVTVSVEADNDAPTAEAGEAQEVQEGSTVTLDGSASTDPEGEALTYSWELESGGDESMVTNPKPADMDAEMVTFTLAVNIPGGTELTFELTVTDPEGLSHTDPVTITVTSTPFEKVLGHALSRFGRALGASAVDTLGERFGSTSKRALDTASINLGNTDLASLARWMPVNAAPPQAMHGGGSEHGMSMAIAGDAGAFGLPGDRVVGSNAAASGPVTANHFHERLRGGGGRSLPIPQLPDRNALLRSSFEIGLSGNPEAGNSLGGIGGLGGIDWTLWGRFDSRAFEAAPEEGSMTLEGSTTIGYVGVDGCVVYCTGVLGIALGSASSDVAFDDDGLEGDIGLSMLGFYPYGSWEFSPSLSAWGLVGMGSGSAEITSDMKHELEADIGMLMLAAGAYQDLGYWWDLVDLALKGDVFMVNTSADAVDGRLSEVTTSVQRIRAGLEVSQSWLLSDGLLALPSLAFSGRMDGGDAETGFGAEFDAGLALKHQSGLSAEVHGRFLLMHQEEDISESGLSVMVHYDPGTPGGLAFALSPTWGDAASVGNALWSGDRLMLGGLADAQHSTTTTSDSLRPDAMHVELQYGMMLRNWLVTPYGTLNTTGSGSGNERWGLRIRALEMQLGEFSLDIFGLQGGSQADASVTPGVQGTLRLPLR